MRNHDAKATLATGETMFESGPRRWGKCRRSQVAGRKVLEELRRPGTGPGMRANPAACSGLSSYGASVQSPASLGGITIVLYRGHEFGGSGQMVVQGGCSMSTQNEGQALALLGTRPAQMPISSCAPGQPPKFRSAPVRWLWDSPSMERLAILHSTTVHAHEFPSMAPTGARPCHARSLGHMRPTTSLLTLTETEAAPYVDIYGRAWTLRVAAACAVDDVCAVPSNAVNLMVKDTPTDTLRSLCPLSPRLFQKLASFASFAWNTPGSSANADTDQPGDGVRLLKRSTLYDDASVLCRDRPHTPKIRLRAQTPDNRSQVQGQPVTVGLNNTTRVSIVCPRLPPSIRPPYGHSRCRSRCRSGL
jgi:hypothetical protein